MDSKKNTGKENSGNRNSGNYNSGYYNSGYYNSGNYNSGHCNSGDYNSGNRNSGNRNSGDYNSGNYNSGYYNSGNYNSGDYNSGYRNSGNRNSGDLNSGDYNSGYRNSGFFNTNEPTVRMFNKDTNLKRSELEIPWIDLKLTEWDSNENVLITRSYKEAWGLAWSKLSNEEKQSFTSLPNFDADIFEEITGVGLWKQKPKDDKIEIEIDGTRIKIPKECVEGIIGLLKKYQE